VDLISTFANRICIFVIVQKEFPFVSVINNSHKHNVDLKIIIPRSTNSDEVIFLVDVCMINIGCPAHMIKSENHLKDSFLKQENIN
jgi:hypothetical protein